MKKITGTFKIWWWPEIWFLAYSDEFVLRVNGQRVLEIQRRQG